MDKADSYIARVKNLPPAPTVATQLLDMFKDPDREVDQIVELISHDPSLTTEVLKTCNGAYYGATEPVADMFEAVTRIGFYEVYTMVVGLVGAAAMNVGRSCSAFDTSALWKHSVTSAVAAETVAQQLGLTPATAFTGGLLHDLGKLLLATIEPARYLELTRKANGDGHALAEAEEAVFGVTHASIGGRLLERWGLPAELSQSVLYHHSVEIPAEVDASLASVIQIANAVARTMETASVPETGLDSVTHAALNRLALDPGRLPEFVQHAQSGLHRVRGLYNMAV